MAAIAPKDGVQQPRTEHGGIDHVVGRHQVCLAKDSEQDLAQFASGCLAYGVQFRVPFGLVIEKCVKIIIGQVILQRDETLAKDFNGKIRNKAVPPANSKPQEIGLLLMTALEKEGKLGGAERFQAGNDLTVDTLESAHGSGLQDIFCDHPVVQSLPIIKIKIERGQLYRFPVKETTGGKGHEVCGVHPEKVNLGDDAKQYGMAVKGKLLGEKTDTYFDLSPYKKGVKLNSCPC